MKFISYSQNFEDVMLWRALKHIQKGFYIDVGANDPEIDSVTKAFYDRGWCGINIEPLALHHVGLVEKRPRDINLHCAVGSTFGLIDLWEPDVRGWATTSKSVIAQHTASGHKGVFHKVPIVPLVDICRKHVSNEIHFMKIDVEGSEKSVIDGMDFTIYRPWILVIEATKPNSMVEDHDKWEKTITDVNYILAYRDGLNRFYIANEHIELLDAFKYPPNVFDDFLLSHYQSSESRIIQTEARAEQAEAKVKQAEAKAKEADVIAAQAQFESMKNMVQLNALYNSKSWRITKPLRWMVKFSIWFLYGSLAWLTLKPGCRPRRAIRLTILYLHNWVIFRPRIKKILKTTIHKLPFLSYRLKKIISTEYKINPVLAESNSSTPIGYFQDIYYYYVDHTVLLPANTGVQRVTRMLARQLIELGKNIRFVKWSDSKKSLVLINQTELHELSKWNGPLLSKIESSHYSEAEVTVSKHSSRDGAWLILPEVPHITKHSQPLTKNLINEAQNLNLMVAAIFYDDIPKYRPELYEVAERHHDYMRELLRADVVLSISQWSNNDLISFAHENRVMPKEDWAVSLPLPSESVLSSRITDLDIAYTSTNTILSVGSITPHKNQLSLVHAFNSYCQKNNTEWTLILAGHSLPGIKEEIEQLAKKNPKIRMVGACSDSELKNLYLSCSFTVFPSLIEGFGLPIVESLWFGKPCICSDMGAMTELSALPGCVVVDTKNLDALEKAIANLIESPELIKKYCEQIISSHLSTWRDYAHKFCYEIDRRNSERTTPILMIDVTELANTDTGTGVQRVTKSLANRLLDKPISNRYRSVLVRKSSLTNGYCVAKELHKFFGYDVPKELSNDSIQVRYGDIFFGLDLSPQIVERDAWLKKAKTCGVKISFMIYDLIPLLSKEYFPPTNDSWFESYLKTIVKYSDQFICISQDTSTKLANWVDEYNPRQIRKPTFVINYLGADIRTSPVDESLTIKNELPKYIQGKINFLIVGTIEPRKGLIQAIEAFSILLKQFPNINLLIVGKQVWKHFMTDEIVEKIVRHEEFNRHLFWFENANDSLLEKIYQVSTVLLAPSFAEGFGLPLIEALRRGIMVLARDIPVFREVVGDNADYFSANSSSELAESMRNLLRKLNSGQYKARKIQSIRTWDECSQQIRNELLKLVPVPKSQRIFWLGAHKLLVQTELPRLRELGYEVFNPPYLSSVEDQSIRRTWDNLQTSTLPITIFNKLSEYNFFYNNISEEIAEILNNYFGSIIVTCSQHWLAPILQCFSGKIIFRTYGQHYLMSQELENMGMRPYIENNKKFIYMPFSEESLQDESDWLVKDCITVPYCIEESLLQYVDTWNLDKTVRKEIALTCPNIDNPYFAEHYKFLKNNFNEPHFKYYGVQLREIQDSQVVGTLDREEQIRCFQESVGYLYTYSDRVCYLPPIEMMLLGGPILFLTGSLLDKFFPIDAPGRCHSIQDAKIKINRLLNKDEIFIHSLQKSQQLVRNRYHPNNVWPRFDQSIRDLITSY